MKKLLPFVFILLAFLHSNSQNSIKGRIVDSTQKAIPFCAMALLQTSDSSLIKGNLGDSSGYFSFEKIKPGNYYIKFNSGGYKPGRSATFSIDSSSQIELPPQVLQINAVNLNEVSVAVYNPVIEFKQGKVIMNVENDELAKGNTVLELLKRLPGVMVDAQNNVTINGIGGVRFMIDGRLQEMPVPQVIDMLGGMSADALAKIELIKNPPARFDAAGTAGLIDIITKRAKMKGYNGNIGFGISQGKRMRFGPSGSFNYKANKLSVFSTFSFGDWDGLNIYTFNRVLTDQGNTEKMTTKVSSESFQQVFSGTGGIEYELTKNLLAGFYVNGNTHADKYVAEGSTQIENSKVFNYSKQLSYSDEIYDIRSPSYNMSLISKLDSSGGQLKFSAGYTIYKEKNDRSNLNYFYGANDLEVAPPSTYLNYSLRKYNVFNQKIDLNKVFKNKLSLEAGLKGNFADNYTKNDLELSNQSTGYFLGDTVFHNGYIYKERILAAYSTLGRTWDKVGFSIGLRAEQTDQKADDIVTEYHFVRNYINLFPSGSLDITLNKKNTISAAYSYRIDRPHYGMLNPIRVFNDQLNYGVGNPELRPQLTHHLNVDHTYRQFITQSMGFDKTKDFTFWYSYTPPESRIYIDTISNLPDRENFYYSLSAQQRIKWYSFRTYGVVIYRTFSGELVGQDVSSKTTQFYANLNQEFFLPKEFRIQLWASWGSGFYDGPQYYLPRSAVHLSVQKSFFDTKLNVTFGYYDVFYKDYFRYSQSFTNQDAYWEDKPDTRRFRLVVNYRFGKMQIQQRFNAEDDSRIQSGR